MNDELKGGKNLKEYFKPEMEYIQFVSEVITDYMSGVYQPGTDDDLD